MSLDLYLEHKCDHCGNEGHITWNYTYNASPMWYEVYPEDDRMIPIDGMTGEQALPKIEKAVAIMKEDPDRFKKLEPTNGWGSYKDFVLSLEELALACRKHPKAVWSSWR